MKKEFNYFDQTAANDDLLPVSNLIQKSVAGPANIFEAATDNLDTGAITTFAAQQLRSQAMATALNWVEQGDFTFNSLSASVDTMNDVDGGDDEDTESSDEMDQEYSDLLTAVALAFVALGADTGNVQAFIENEDDAEGVKLGEYLSGKIAEATDDDETVITKYAIGGDLVLESVIKVIRNGQLAFKKKRIGRPHKMTSLQRASLKKARSKAFTGAARFARKKSMKIRKNRGM